MNFGSNKILFERKQTINLSQAPRSFFYQDYTINHFIRIPDERRSRMMNLMVVNGNALAITDLDFNEILCRIYFTRDVTTKLKEKIRQHNIREEERSRRETAVSKIRSISHDNSTLVNSDFAKIK